MLPLQFDLAKYPTSETIRLLSSLLERMTIANDILNKQQQQQKTPVYTRFHARLVPSIDIYSYLCRILKYCPCANECFLSLLVYFDRMSKNSISLTGKPFTIDSFNIHRLIITGVMVSSKFFSDVFYTNTRYAKVGGLPVKELNNLEIEFLKLNNFNLSIPIPELQKYADQLLKVTTQKHARSTSFDQPRNDIDKVCDLTQRMSLDEQYHVYYHYQQQRNRNQIRRMTSASSLENNNGNTYEQPRQSRSSVNLQQQQGFWKPNSPQTTENKTGSSRKLSLTSIYAPPFIPEAYQQQQQHGHGYYYYPPIGIPTPPPSASPVYYQPTSYTTMYL